MPAAAAAVEVVVPVVEFRHTLRRDLDEVYPFFTDPANLERLTPPWLSFEILSPQVEMAVGARIDYRLRWRGLPMRWTSEITAFEPGRRFVDEQRRGPYRRWVHEHLFLPAEGGGTEVVDRVDYAVWGGAPVDRIFVRRDVERIFAFRRRALEEIFPTPSGG